jgi:hypothetical protein
MKKLQSFKQSSELPTLENSLKSLDKFNFAEKKEDKYLSHITFTGRPSVKDVITFMMLKTGWSGRIFVGAKTIPQASGVYIPVVDYGPYTNRFPDNVYVSRITTHTHRGKTDVFVEIGGKSNARKRKSIEPV